MSEAAGLKRKAAPAPSPRAKRPELAPTPMRVPTAAGRKEAFRESVAGRAPNRTGLPERLKAGIEALSGLNMDDVHVYLNSARPHRLQARAFAQGRDIHVAAGQEAHLPHEAWHVVQQKQGRVQPTGRGPDNVPLADHAGLEREATTMGAKALGFSSSAPGRPPREALRNTGPSAPVQRWTYTEALAHRGLSAPSGTTERADAGELSPIGLAAVVSPHIPLVEAGEIKDVKKSRVDALSEAARRFAAIGSTVTQLGQPGPNQVPLTWAGAVNQLAPFVYRVAVPYSKPGAKQKKPFMIELQYQMAPALRGYVIRQKDTGDQAAASIQDGGTANPAASGQTATFNMQHHDTRDSAIGAIVERDSTKTKGEHEAALDARTKLAGEGARWLLVLHNMNKIRDFSRIWTAVPKTQFIHYVRFNMLWLNWGDTFEHRFSIPDSEVARKLRQPSEWTSGKVQKVKREQFKPDTADIEVMV